MSVDAQGVPAADKQGVVARVRRANTRLAPENSIALRVAVTVAVLAAGTATIRQGVGGGLLTVAVIVGIPAANVFSHVTRRREGYLLKAMLAVGILLAFAGFLAEVRGIGVGLVSDVQVPLAELFLWTQLLHSLDVPARRDLQFSMVSSLVLMAIAGVLSIRMDFALHLAVWAVAALTALVLFHRSELREKAVVPRSTRVAAPVAGGAARPVLIVLGLIFVLGTATFLVAPPSGTVSLAFPVALPEEVRVRLPGGVSNSTLGDQDPSRRDDPDSQDGSGPKSFAYFGFSDRMDTAARGRPDNTLVMRVRAPRPDFWRGQTFDVWDGRVWTMSADRPRRIAGFPPLLIPRAQLDANTRGSEMVQTYYLERAGPNLIFAAYAPDQLYFPDNFVFQMPDGSLRAGVELTEDAVYTVISRRPRVTEEILRSPQAEFGPTPPTFDRYLQLPEVPQRVRDLAERVTASSPTTYDKVRALEDWMAQNTEYTLDIPPLPRGADSVEQFLFVDRKGFCEQIGSSLVVMLRSLGIPARLAVGYAAGERNPFTGLYEVRARDAHAWAEVWFPGIGWQGFDPTAKVPLAGDAGPRAAGSGLLGYLNARLPSIPWAGRAAGYMAVAVVVAAAIGQLWFVVARRRRLAQRTWAAVVLERLEAAGAERGRPRRPSQTIAEYLGDLQASVLPDRRLAGVAEALQTEVFSGDRVDDARRQEAIEAVERAVAGWPAPAPRRRLAALTGRRGP